MPRLEQWLMAAIPLPPRTPANMATTPLFPLGHVLATPQALQLLAQFDVQAFTLINRHVTGDWGDTGSQDRWKNNMALCNSERIVSAYKLTRQDGAERIAERLVVITEADRSWTCVLTRDEY
jgi:hypothetical protein